MKNRKLTRLLAVLLVAALCLSLLPAIVLATEATTYPAWDANDQGYSDGDLVTSDTIAEGITVEFAKGVGNNPPVYKTSGSAIRCYPNNTFTVTSTIGKITKITIGYANDTPAVTANCGKFTNSNDSDWTGEADSVTFTIDPDASSGHRRIQTITVTVAPASGGSTQTEERPLTSNATIEGGEKFDNNVTINFGDKSCNGYKLGTSSKGGDMTVKLPKGATGIQFFVGAWKEKTAAVTITYGTETKTINVAGNAGFTSNSPFTFEGDVNDYFQSIDFAAPLGAALDMKISTPNGSNGRAIFFGVNVLGGEDSNPDTPDTPDTPETPDPVSIEDALKKNAGETITGTVTGFVTLDDGKNVYIQSEDAKFGIDIYFGNIARPEGLKVGQKISVTNSKYDKYDGLPELVISAASKVEIVDATVAELTYNTVTSIADITDAMICTAIKYTGKLTVTNTYWGDYDTPNLTVSDGTNTAVLYKAKGDLEKGKDYNDYTTDSVVGALSIKDSGGKKTLRIINTVKLSLTAPTTDPGTETTDPSTETTDPSTQPTTPPADSKTAGLSNSVKEGDKVYIYYVDEKLVLSGTAKGKKLDSVAGTVTDGKLAITDGMLELIVSVNDKGQYTFKTADGKFLTSGATGSELKLADTASDYSLWTLEASGNAVKIKNVNAKYGEGDSAKPQYLEYYNGFTTYGYQSDKDGIYRFQLYVLNAEPEKPATPPTGDNSMAIVGVVLMVLAVSGVAVLVVGRKKWMR